MVTIPARRLSLQDVHRLLGYQGIYDGDFASELSLEPITEIEKQELIKIRQNLEPYLISEQFSEGQVKLFSVVPLLQLAGFYHPSIAIAIEENIARIETEDEDTVITGRFDLMAINRERLVLNNAYFCILVIESKRFSISQGMGLSQLLAYAYPCLKNQPNVWGLTTNGLLYQFVYIKAGDRPTYQYMPLLNLQETKSSIELLQVLKAIRQL